MGALRLRALSAAAAALALAGCATTGRPGTSLPQGARYVSLGSSFAAGAGIGAIKPGTPTRCGRTENNYATLLAQRLSLALDDQGCGGARTTHVLGPWDELPPQIDAVTPDTRLVTITIGGNDLNYVGSLFTGACNSGLPCRPLQATDAAAFAGVEQRMRAIGEQVRARAPQATLVFVQYVTLVPEGTCPEATFTPQNAAVLKALARGLAEATARAAKDTGARVLPADELSRDHAPCSAQPWARGMPPGYDRKAGAPWHPTAAGHAAIADALAAMVAPEGRRP